MIELLKKVLDPTDKKDLVEEITYLAHIRKSGQKYEREKSLEFLIDSMMTNYNQYEYNYKVLVVLIETGYIQQVMQMDLEKYPKFLVGMLENSDRLLVKEACCRRIIKFFGKYRKDDGNEGGDIGKIEFITLVQPLTSIISRPKENGARLTALSVMSIVNMCDFSDDIKDIFLQRNGIAIIKELMESKDEDILLSALRLIMTLIAPK